MRGVLVVVLLLGRFWSKHQTMQPATKVTVTCVSSLGNTCLTHTLLTSLLARRVCLLEGGRRRLNA